MTPDQQSTFDRYIGLLWPFALDQTDLADAELEEGYSALIALYPTIDRSDTAARACIRVCLYRCGQRLHEDGRDPEFRHWNRAKALGGDCIHSGGGMLFIA